MLLIKHFSSKPPKSQIIKSTIKRRKDLKSTDRLINNYQHRDMLYKIIREGLRENPRGVPTWMSSWPWLCCTFVAVINKHCFSKNMCEKERAKSKLVSLSRIYLLKAKYSIGDQRVPAKKDFWNACFTLSSILCTVPEFK